ncbi:MAG: hypothetical protein AAFX76_07645 [Planctomycetota bacterium]
MLVNPLTKEVPNNDDRLLAVLTSPSPIASAAFDPSDPRRVYAGLHDGRIAYFVLPEYVLPAESLPSTVEEAQKNATEEGAVAGH